MATDKKILVVNEKQGMMEEIDVISNRCYRTKIVLQCAVTAILAVTAVLLFIATFYVIRERATTAEDGDFTGQQISLNENIRGHSSTNAIDHQNDEEFDIVGPDPDSESRASTFQESTDAIGSFSRLSSVGDSQLAAPRQVRDVDDPNEELVDLPASLRGVQHPYRRFLVQGFRQLGRFRVLANITRPVQRARRSPQTEQWLGEASLNQPHREELMHIQRNYGSSGEGFRVRAQFGRRVQRTRRSPHTEQRPRELNLNQPHRDEEIQEQTRTGIGFRIRAHFGRRRA